MNRVYAVILTLILPSAALGQDSRAGRAGAVLAEGRPPLTQGMVDKVRELYEYALDLRLTPQQRDRFRRGLIVYWEAGNRERMNAIVNNVALAGQPDKVRLMRELHQEAVVEALRREAAAGGDLAPQVLVEAFDEAHTGRRQATRARGFAELVGVWKSEDYLHTSKQKYTGAESGVAFVDSRKLEIFPDGRFKHMRVHEHRNAGEECSRQDAQWEEGTVAVEGTRLVFRIKSGHKKAIDGCRPQLSGGGPVKPYTLSVSWSIRPHIFRKEAQMLCWTSQSENSVCYEKQK